EMFAVWSDIGPLLPHDQYTISDEDDADKRGVHPLAISIIDSFVRYWNNLELHKAAEMMIRAHRRNDANYWGSVGDRLVDYDESAKKRKKVFARPHWLDAYQSLHHYLHNVTEMVNNEAVNCQFLIDEYNKFLAYRNTPLVKESQFGGQAMREILDAWRATWVDCNTDTQKSSLELYKSYVRRVLELENKNDYIVLEKAENSAKSTGITADDNDSLVGSAGGSESGGSHKSQRNEVHISNEQLRRDLEEK